MAGIIYLVATPIGNLGDFSPRAVETLRSADFIAAEDTRVSMKLLNHFEIKKPLVSYHEHNRAAAGQAILARLLGGETCALVTDAGTPAISDPGEDLVRLCSENGVTVQAVPGCCAAVLCAHILPRLERGTQKRVLFLATGALMSQTTFLQKESIPAIAHLVELAAPEKGAAS